LERKFRAIQGGAAKQNTESFFDYTLLITVLFLLFFGLIMIYSSSSYKANLTFEDSGYYLKKQLVATVLGLVAMFVVSRIPYHFWEKLSIPAMVISVVLIFLVLTPLGYEANGARRWLNLGISLQPAEVAKLAVIIFMSYMVCQVGRGIRQLKTFIVLLVPAGFLFIIVWKITENMSSAIIIMGIAVSIIFVASPDYKKYVVISLCLIAVIAIMVYVLKQNQDASSLGFRFQRILAWINPEAYASGKGFQTLQALYAIGSGGIFGKGLGESMQKLGFLPEAQNDMIFSIICEELGLFGAIAVMLLFLVLIWRCMVVANNAPDLFGALLVVGVMAHFAIQVILNIAVCTNTIPNTGISLPFISYGGSSVVFLLIEIGIVLNVARSIHLKEL